MGNKLKNSKKPSNISIKIKMTNYLNLNLNLAYPVSVLSNLILKEVTNDLNLSSPRSLILTWLISKTKDEESPEQIEDSFNVLAGGKDHVTVNDMKVGQLSQEQIDHLTSVLPPMEGIDGGFNYRAYVANLF